MTAFRVILLFVLFISAVGAIAGPKDQIDGKRLLLTFVAAGVLFLASFTSIVA